MSIVLDKDSCRERLILQNRDLIHLKAIWHSCIKLCCVLKFKDQALASNYSLGNKYRTKVTNSKLSMFGVVQYPFV